MAHWTRRAWLVGSTAAIATTRRIPWSRASLRRLAHVQPTSEQTPGWDALAQQAVEAARRAGAQYADAHLTHALEQEFDGRFDGVHDSTERIGVGVRALVNGYWGFSAMPGGDTNEVERLARAAVAQAKSNARGTRRTVDLGTVPTAAGNWTMPVRIDPFAVSIEEKLEYLRYWSVCADSLGAEQVLNDGKNDSAKGTLRFVRQKRVVATSDGSQFTQTVYESGGEFGIGNVRVKGIEPSGQGWELFLDANIPEQLQAAMTEFRSGAASTIPVKQTLIGSYTLVCDGATMAALLNRTIGVATQLDRALGYEANASGSTYLNDPITMLGEFKVASPLVTVTGNRSVPGQLATVKWDAEGIEPQPFTLVRDGVLVDFQTTREQAAWLAPYYQRLGTSVQSHGCAGSEDALTIPLQHPPNLAMTPGIGGATLDELVAHVSNGILITNGDVDRTDFQARTGLLRGTLREIRNGRLGAALQGGAVYFDALELWRHVVAVGGAGTQMIKAVTRSSISNNPLLTGRTIPTALLKTANMYPVKGQPPQFTSYSVQGVAATITNQPVIDPRRKV